jgi:MFS family permease
LLPVMLMGFIGTFGFNFQITNALVAQGVFHRGAGSYGILSTAQAVGSLAGALFAAHRRQQPRVRLLVISALVFSVLVAASGFLPSYQLFMLLLLPIGGAGILLATSCNAMLQLGASPDMQGRVMALYTTVFVGCAPFGSLLVGWLGGGLGPRWALFVGGLICAVSVLGCALYYVRAQRLEIRVADHVWWPRTLADDELEEEALLADVRAR